MLKIYSFMLAFLLCLSAEAQLSVILNQQQCFPSIIPPGNYSGITWLGGNRFAVVSDKSPFDGFFIFDIRFNHDNGSISSIKNLGFRSSDIPDRDDEGIAWNTKRHTLFISGESDNRIVEYDTLGTPTTFAIATPHVFRHLPDNQGLEALSYSARENKIYTCNETAPITILGIDSTLSQYDSIHYEMDPPKYNNKKHSFYAHGIGTICSIGTDSLLVLEREAHVPPLKIGAKVSCKLFLFNLTNHKKELVCEWQTGLGLADRSFANYEGMCLGPTLADGSRVLIMVADSQGQYAGVLRDWFKTAVIVKRHTTGNQ